MSQQVCSWLDVVEAVCRVERSEEDWLRAVVDAAFRLRQQLEQPEVPALEAPAREPSLRDSEGSIPPPFDPALARAAQEVLRGATIRLDQVRNPSLADAEDGVSRCRALIGSRWTLLDRFEVLGRRYVLAVETRSRGSAALSLRERQILAFAGLGYSNKLIAYELGISHSTVKVLLSRAAAKLGVTSRQEMVNCYTSQSAPPPSFVEPGVGSARSSANPRPDVTDTRRVPAASG